MKKRKKKISQASANRSIEALQDATNRLRLLAESCVRLPHGTRARYNSAGCRCDDCRIANTVYERKRVRRNIFHANPLIDAEPVRQHLLSLETQGIGLRSIGKAVQMRRHVLQELRTGIRCVLRKEQAERILATSDEARGDRSLISARASWRLLDELVDDGWTKKQLAKWLGYRNGVLQFSRDQITALSAKRIEELYRQIREGFLRRTA